MEALEPSGHSHGKPEDGLECLCTMEDITEDEGNYVEFRAKCHPRVAVSAKALCDDSAASWLRRQLVGSAGSKRRHIPRRRVAVRHPRADFHSLPTQVAHGTRAGTARPRSGSCSSGSFRIMW